MKKKKYIHRGKKSTREEASKIDDSETFEHGPFTIHREGKYISITSRWDSRQHKLFIENLRNRKPDFKRAVDIIISKFESLVVEYNPLSIIAEIQKLVQIRASGISSDSTDESLIEYLMSIATSKPYSSTWKEPKRAEIEKALSLWNELELNVSNYFGSEFVTNQENPVEAELRFKLILSYLFRRGDAYIQHLDQTFLELFRKQSQYLENTIGFSAQDLYEFFQRVKSKYLLTMQQERDIFDTIAELHGKFNTGLLKSREDVQCEPRSIHSDLRPLELLYAFEVEPQKTTDDKILQCLSCELGNNVDFLSPAKTEWRGWPTNDTIISLRPIIKHNQQYYVFNPSLALRNLRLISEHLLKQQSPNQFQKYLKSRDEYVEETSLRYIRTLLPSSKVFPKLRYGPIEGSKPQLYELDGLVIYDDVLIIIEAKAGQIPRQKKRGSIQGIIDSLSEILTKANDQATRALRFIKSAPSVIFYNDRGVPVVQIEQKKFENIFIILINDEPLYELSSHLSTAKKLGLVIGKEWPWFVYLNDLRIVSEIINHPSIFLHYLRERIAQNEDSLIEAFDEMDYFGRFLQNDLSHQEERFKDVDRFMISSHTQDLDAYYSSSQVQGSITSKPYFKMDSVFEALLSRLEDEQPNHFVSVCLHLLESNEAIRSKIVKIIKGCEKQKIRKGTPVSKPLVIGKISVIFGCMENIESRKEDIVRLGNRKARTMNVERVYIICWTPPISRGKIRIFKFSKETI